MDDSSQATTPPNAKHTTVFQAPRIIVVSRWRGIHRCCPFRRAAAPHPRCARPRCHGARAAPRNGRGGGCRGSRAAPPRRSPPRAPRSRRCRIRRPRSGPPRSGCSPVARALAGSVSRSIGCTEQASMTRTAILSAASSSCARSASNRVTPAARHSGRVVRRRAQHLLAAARRARRAHGRDPEPCGNVLRGGDRRGAILRHDYCWRRKSSTHPRRGRGGGASSARPRGPGSLRRRRTLQRAPPAQTSTRPSGRAGSLRRERAIRMLRPAQTPNTSVRARQRRSASPTTEGRSAGADRPARRG